MSSIEQQNAAVQQECGDCGAEAGEECAPLCLGVAAAQDEHEDTCHVPEFKCRHCAGLVRLQADRFHYLHVGSGSKYCNPQDPDSGAVRSAVDVTPELVRIPCSCARHRGRCTNCGWTTR